ncbi:unnamed protein product [Paramecium pentaurelia]|uniref:Uncharacterized protein n=1 Tax=Paramecium pentaurelia TaxID=43138 RepID=A0A8S1VSP5_9CILI|nr:unnamed protein product [Paramecium pentaurelia]
MVYQNQIVKHILFKIKNLICYCFENKRLKTYQIIISKSKSFIRMLFHYLFISLLSCKNQLKMKQVYYFYNEN